MATRSGQQIRGARGFFPDGQKKIALPHCLANVVGKEGGRPALTPQFEENSSARTRWIFPGHQ